MSDGRPAAVLFAEAVYPFIQPTLDEGRVVMVQEPSELFETARKDNIPIILFDTAHSRYTESLVTHTYRKTPLSEFWLLAAHDNHAFPDYVIDAVFPHNTRKTEFEKRLTSCIRIKSLLREYGLVGKSADLKRTAEMVAQVAPTMMSTLIIGPSGSGKELVAHAVHDHSARKNRTFMAINCGALVETLLESELFGYEKGAFTGAIGRREGIFKRADGGTVFLDEIGETSPAMQVKLLRVLEEGSFYRVGGDELVHTDVRIVAATNRELTEAIMDNKFREDLYYRLGAVRINLAGLVDRKADVLPLINHFFKEETGVARGISEKALEHLLNYGWPGNVRQLRNFVNRMIVAAPGEISDRLVLQYIEEQGFTNRSLPVVTGRRPQEAEFQLIYQALLSLGQEVRMLRDIILDNIPRHGVVDAHDLNLSSTPGSMEDMEEELIKKTLASVGGNRREAAKQLGIGERTLYRKLKKYGEI